MGTARDQLKLDIGARIRVLRARKDLTQAALTERISTRMGEPVGKDQIGRWENGENLPEVDALLALAAEFDTSLEALVMGEQNFFDRVVQELDRRVSGRIARIEKHVGLA